MSGMRGVDGGQVDGAGAVGPWGCRMIRRQGVDGRGIVLSGPLAQQDHCPTEEEVQQQQTSSCPGEGDEVATGGADNADSRAGKVDEFFSA